jgi:transketolase
VPDQGPTRESPRGCLSPRDVLKRAPGSTRPPLSRKPERSAQAVPPRLANAIRALAMDAVEAANSGHPGMPMGMADAATALFTAHLKHDPADPQLARPRPLRAVGRPRLDADLRAAPPDRLRPADDRRHPQFPPARQPVRRPPREFHADGVETTTGPLGQGLATAVGMAIAERHLNASTATIWSTTAPG